MNKPHRMFQDELTESYAQGASYMAQMVQGSLGAGEMPPREIVEWYAKHVTYEFIAAEHAVAHGETAMVEALKKLAAEVVFFRKLFDKNQMFAPSSAITDLLRQRTMHLPPGYTPLISP